MNNLSEYYKFKVKSYTEKYNIGYYTHLHTGTYDPLKYPFLFDPQYNFDDLNNENLKYLLFAGQENLKINLLK